ncbi:MAG TPA: pseudouridine-5'-phosphate glycosidase [Gemmatimonadales bacterium]
MSDLVISQTVRTALEAGAPIVALESTVIAHGLPWPENLALALRLEATVREQGAVPATVAVLGGAMRVGLEPGDLEQVARGDHIDKLSRRDLPIALARGTDGATTVSATMLIAHAAGIVVLATGGIGGVHRDDRNDVSGDLPELARTPMIVVCSGAKAILDLPATLEWLETHGVPVIGYGTSEFPAFFTRSSGLPLEARAETPSEVAAVARAAWRNGLDTAVLVTVPCPAGAALSAESMEAAVTRAVLEAGQTGVKGKVLTPYLLRRVAELTGGQSRAANRALLDRNAEVAAMIARALYPGG